MGVICALAGPSRATAAESPTPKEYQIKAAFLYNFTKFVEWPAGKFQESNSPLVIGLVGKGPICAAVEAAVKDRKINGRDLVVKAVETPEAAKTVHLLFLASSEDERVEGLLSAAKDASVLTVGESESFAKLNGMINFTPEGDKLRFEINMDAAEAAGLKISAQLQKLAKTVRRKK